MNTTDTAHLRELLGAAGQSPEKYTEAVRGIWNAAPSLLDELDSLRARVAELEADRNLFKAMAGRAQEGLRCAMNGFPNLDSVGAAYDNSESARAWLAARDARMRREGAAEWLERFAAENQERFGTHFVETTTDSLLAEAARLREGGE